MLRRARLDGATDRLRHRGSRSPAAGRSTHREGVWPLVTAAEMQALDRQTIEGRGIPGEILMESAGRALVEPVLALRSGSPRPERPVRAFCGAGNNGGDGFVAVRHLLAEGIAAEAVLVGDPDRLPADAAANWRRLVELGRTASGLSQRASRGCGLRLDGDPRRHERRARRALRDGPEAPARRRGGAPRRGAERGARARPPRRRRRSALGHRRRYGPDPRRRRRRRSHDHDLAPEARSRPRARPQSGGRASRSRASGSTIRIPRARSGSSSGTRARRRRRFPGAPARWPQGPLRPRADRRGLDGQMGRGLADRAGRAALGGRARDARAARRPGARAAESVRGGHDGTGARDGGRRALRAPR